MGDILSDFLAEVSLLPLDICCYCCSQGVTNPLPSCLGQVQILAGQVIFYFTCPEKCIEYIKNIVISSYFQDAVDCRTSG